MQSVNKPPTLLRLARVLPWRVAAEDKPPPFLNIHPTRFTCSICAGCFGSNEALSVHRQQLLSSSQPGNISPKGVGPDFLFLLVSLSVEDKAPPSCVVLTVVRPCG